MYVHIEEHLHLPIDFDSFKWILVKGLDFVVREIPKNKPKRYLSFWVAKNNIWGACVPAFSGVLVQYI